MAAELSLCNLSRLALVILWETLAGWKVWLRVRPLFITRKRNPLVAQHRWTFYFTRDSLYRTCGDKNMFMIWLQEGGKRRKGMRQHILILNISFVFVINISFVFVYICKDMLDEFRVRFDHKRELRGGGRGRGRPRRPSWVWGRVALYLFYFCLFRFNFFCQIFAFVIHIYMIGRKKVIKSTWWL